MRPGSEPILHDRCRIDCAAKLSGVHKKETKEQKKFACNALQRYIHVVYSIYVRYDIA
jgi:hypothetical protein